MIEVYQDGKLKAKLENVGTGFQSEDIVVLPAAIAKNVIMTSKSFEDLFYEYLKENFPHATNITHEQAYNKAERIHEQYLGKRRYKNFESFRMSRDQRMTKGR